MKKWRNQTQTPNWFPVFWKERGPPTCSGFGGGGCHCSKPRTSSRFGGEGYRSPKPNLLSTSDFKVLLQVVCLAPSECVCQVCRTHFFAWQGRRRCRIRAGAVRDGPCAVHMRGSKGRRWRRRCGLNRQLRTTQVKQRVGACVELRVNTTPHTVHFHNDSHSCVHTHGSSLGPHSLIPSMFHVSCASCVSLIALSSTTPFTCCSSLSSL